MTTRPRPPDAASSLSRYHTAHCGVVTDRHGKFERFVRKLDAAHLKNGYWRFTTILDEQRAYAVGHQTPESILSAVHYGDGTYHDIQLRWVPGSDDQDSSGPPSGNAAQHLKNIHEARRFLGKSMAIPGNVPLYPLEPRMKGYWDAKRTAASTANTVAGRSTPVISPLPSSQSSRLPSPQAGATAVGSRASHAGFDHGWNIYRPSVADPRSPTASNGPQISIAPSRSSSRTPTGPMQPHSPLQASTSPYLSSGQHVASTQRSRPASITTDSSPQRTPATASSANFSRISMDGDQGFSGSTGSGRSSPAHNQRPRPSVHSGPSSQSHGDVRLSQNLDQDQHHRGSHSSGPSRPDVMAGHLNSGAAPSSLTHRSRAAPATSNPPVMPLVEAYNILGLSSSLEPSDMREARDQEATESQLIVVDGTPPRLSEPNDMVGEGPFSVGFDQSPDNDSLPVGTSAETNDGSSATSTNSQQAVSLVAEAKPSSIERSESTQTASDRDSHVLEHATSRSQPIIEDMYPDLPCMECSQEAGHHTLDCCIGHLQPMKNLTMLDYRNLAEATKRFDPGPWTEHQGPPPEPEQESVDDQIHGMAEVVRNEDSYKDDASLHALPDDMMVLLWAFKTSSNVKVVDE